MAPRLVCVPKNAPQRRQSRIHFPRASTLESRHHIFGEEVQTYSFCYVGDIATSEK
jgi:hypothetical protein